MNPRTCWLAPHRFFECPTVSCLSLNSSETFWFSPSEGLRVFGCLFYSNLSSLCSRCFQLCNGVEFCVG